MFFQISIHTNFHAHSIFLLNADKRIDLILGDICWENMSRLIHEGDKFEISFKVVLILYLLIVHHHLKKTGKNGLTVTLTTDLPIGGGLGSSGSMSVALASCFLVLCGDVGGNADSWTSTDVDVINKYAYTGEFHTTLVMYCGDLICTSYPLELLKAESQKKFASCFIFSFHCNYFDNLEVPLSMQELSSYEEFGSDRPVSKRNSKF